MQDDKKIALFERTPVPRAVALLSVPTIPSSLVLARLFQKMDRADRDRAETVEG